MRLNAMDGTIYGVEREGSRRKGCDTADSSPVLAIDISQDTKRSVLCIRVPNVGVICFCIIQKSLTPSPLFDPTKLCYILLSFCEGFDR